MSDSRIRYWRRFSSRIISVSSQDGVILRDFILRIRSDKSIFQNYEILDFQRYKVIKKTSKIVDFILSGKEEQRFRFLVGKN